MNLKDLTNEELVHLKEEIEAVRAERKTIEKKKKVSTVDAALGYIECIATLDVVEYDGDMVEGAKETLMKHFADDQRTVRTLVEDAGDLSNMMYELEAGEGDQERFDRYYREFEKKLDKLKEKA